MTAKILINRLGQHIIAGVKQVERTVEGGDNELVAYWLTEPRVITYNANAEGEVTIGFGALCPVAQNNEFAYAESFVVSILDPVEAVAQRYEELVAPVLEPATEEAPAEEATEEEAAE